MRKYIASQVSIVWYITTHLYSDTVTDKKLYGPLKGFNFSYICKSLPKWGQRRLWDL